MATQVYASGSPCSAFTMQSWNAPYVQPLEPQSELRSQETQAHNQSSRSIGSMNSAGINGLRLSVKGRLENASTVIITVGSNAFIFSLQIAPSLSEVPSFLCQIAAPNSRLK